MWMSLQGKAQKRLRADSVVFSATRKALDERLASSAIPPAKRQRVETEVDLLKSELTNGHFRKVLIKMTDEQKR
jgi:hypothetical protein